jgi:hypothetical protein
MKHSTFKIEFSDLLPPPPPEEPPEEPEGGKPERPVELCCLVRLALLQGAFLGVLFNNPNWRNK